MSKQIVVGIYSGILFSQKKEWNTGTCYHVDKPEKYYDKRKKLDEKGHILYEMSKIDKSIGTEIRLVVNRGRERRQFRLMT